MAASTAIAIRIGTRGEEPPPEVEAPPLEWAATVVAGPPSEAFADGFLLAARLPCAVPAPLPVLTLFLPDDPPPEEPLGDPAVRPADSDWDARAWACPEEVPPLPGCGGLVSPGIVVCSGS